MDFSTLQSRISTVRIPPHRTQLHPRMHSSSSSSSFKSLPSQASQSQLRWWTLAALLFLVPFFFYLLALGRGVHLSAEFSESKPKGFAVLLHAAPTWTQVRIFEFLNEGPRVPFVGRADGSGIFASTKSRPGLGELGAEGAAKAVMGFLDFARERVPRAEWKDTKVWLMGTGGLGEAVPVTREKVLESCRRVLRSSGFMFRDEWVSLISGEEQGLYSWVAANYALGTLGADPQETTGIIELGGASAQVTFAPRELPTDFSKMIKFAGVTYHLYSRSMLQFGQDAAWELLLKRHKSRVLTSSSSSSQETVMDPCIPKGYNQSTSPNITLNRSEKQLRTTNSMGNFSACRSVALSLLQKGQDKCLRPPCTIVSSFMPVLQGKPIVVDNFFYTSEFFGVFPKASLLDIEAAGRHYCEGDWANLNDEYHGVDEMDLLRYCFSSAFTVAFLHDGLGISMDDKRVGFANQMGSAPLDWTLGAFIKQAAEDPEKGLDNVAHIIGDDTVTYLSLFAILCLVILAALIMSNFRKPQFKTVYDLEKGRYIVTRVPR
eukprot:TRINITY_DN10174_c0_g1_i1.p1 TRINITY_DN10174_c0_g1~~TRINITY_DN10174_c0_g1_i1.p1  ORF type:complete len:546 (+),score=96.18 TRINITY_DN10174_c0_g1_i1:205-1842(+)